MGVGSANCYAPEMGCGASVPAGELENELKIEKTKNEEAQRQLDHMKELYQRERERNKDLRNQLKLNASSELPNSSEAPREPEVRGPTAEDGAPAPEEIADAPVEPDAPVDDGAPAAAEEPERAASENPNVAAEGKVTSDDAPAEEVAPAPEENADAPAGDVVAEPVEAVEPAEAEPVEAVEPAEAEPAEAVEAAKPAEPEPAEPAEAEPAEAVAAVAVPIAAPIDVPVADPPRFGPYGPEHEASALKIQTSARGKLARSASKRIREEIKGCPYGVMDVSETWAPDTAVEPAVDPGDDPERHRPIWSKLRTNLHAHATKDPSSPAKPHGERCAQLWRDASTLAKTGAFDLAIEAYWRFVHERMSELGHTRYGVIPPFFAHDHQDYLNALYNVATLLEAQAVDPGSNPTADEILHPEQILRADPHAQAYGIFSELVEMNDAVPASFWVTPGGHPAGAPDAAARREGLLVLAADRGRAFTAHDLATHDRERAVAMSYRGGNSASRDEAHAGGVLLSRHGKHEEAAEMFARAADISLAENKKHSALYAINAQFGSLLRLGVVHENRDEDDAKVREVRDRFRRVAGEPDGMLGDASSFANQGRHPGALAILTNEVLRFRRYELTLRDPRKSASHGPSPWPVYDRDVAWVTHRIAREFEAMRWYPEALQWAEEAIGMFEGCEGSEAAAAAAATRRRRDDIARKLATRDATLTAFRLAGKLASDASGDVTGEASMS